MKTKIRIGTRGSQLALIQSRQVQERLLELWPQAIDSIELITIKTSGDQHQDHESLWRAEPGFFVREIENALLRGDIEVAVHSLKDLPSKNRPGLRLAAHLRREEPNDVLCAVNREISQKIFAGLMQGKSHHPYRFGSSSPRRTAMLKYHLANCIVEPLRGNVDTRLRKIEQGNFDATLLAAAGLKRLNRLSADFQMIPLEMMVPAAAQGVIVVQCREDDETTAKLLQPLNDVEAEISSMAERSFMATIAAGCRSAVGVYAQSVKTVLHMRAQIFSLDGQQRIEQNVEGTMSDAVQLGKRLAEQCLLAGAERLLI